MSAGGGERAAGHGRRASEEALRTPIRGAGLEYSADPLHRRPGELNDNNGGRGLYIHDPDGHNLEFLTRPITA